MSRRQSPGKSDPKEHRYGRGKFEAHPNYVKYMRMVVDNPAYVGMPNATSSDGRINWQVSSGRTTAFYKHYVARTDWWVEKADELKLPGKGNQQERFSIAARRIHPTGYRACRLCGEDRNVGYFYLNKSLATRLDVLTHSARFSRAQPIDEVIEILKSAGGQELVVEVLTSLFPEREEYFDKHGTNAKAFEASNHLRTRWLSPGFMANPPDRLDGFHDYCVRCRQRNDPGRSEENLRSYQHDRRAFQWWAEGDWGLADALYNSAGPGRCSICGCGVDRVSPDHVGPLACGFKQLPLFMPTCPSCNSSKNRRMRFVDVEKLIAYEEATGESAASWQVRGMWDAHKNKVKSDGDARELSTHMRALQDGYLRCLYALLESGQGRFLTSLLSPRYAFFTHQFEGLNRATLEFDKVTTTPEETLLRTSLAHRSVRIAFEELAEYVQKRGSSRKVKKLYSDACARIARAIVDKAEKLPASPLDRRWSELIALTPTTDNFELGIAQLIGQSDRNAVTKDRKLRELLMKEFYEVGARASIAFA